MGDYFKPLRRKIGLLTLVVACVFAAGWVISFCYDEDEFDYFPVGFGRSIGIQGQSIALMRLMTSGDSMPLIESDDGVFPIEPLAPGESALLVVFTAPFWSIVIPLTLLSGWLLLSKPRTKKPA